MISDFINDKEMTAKIVSDNNGFNDQKMFPGSLLGVYRHMDFTVFHLQLYRLINIRIQSYFDFVQLYEFDIKVFLSNLHH